jgi:hypothetical protein
LALLARKYPGVAERILHMDTLLIDEVSMLSDTLFEKVSDFLKLMKKNKKPFGGVQLVLVGDPFQLCPVEVCVCESSVVRHLVMTSHACSQGSYCFTSPLWAQCDFKVHRLETNMRQKGGVCVCNEGSHKVD